MSTIDLLIVDEAHHFPATFWKIIVELAKTQRTKVLLYLIIDYKLNIYLSNQIIFLTATPYRTDRKLVIPDLRCNMPQFGEFYQQFGNKPFFHLKLADAQLQYV